MQFVFVISTFQLLVVHVLTTSNNTSVNCFILSLFIVVDFHQPFPITIPQVYTTIAESSPSISHTYHHSKPYDRRRKKSPRVKSASKDDAPVSRCLSNGVDEANVGSISHTSGTGEDGKPTTPYVELIAMVRP